MNIQESELEVAGVKAIDGCEGSEAIRKTQKNKIDKIAVVGAGPVARIVVKAVLGIIGKLQSARFFNNEDKALVWVKEE